MPIFAKSIFAVFEKCLSHKAGAEKAVLLLPLHQPLLPQRHQPLLLSVLQQLCLKEYRS